MGAFDTTWTSGAAAFWKRRWSAASGGSRTIVLPASKSRSANAAEYSDGAFDRSRAVAVRRTPPVLAYSLAASGTASMVTAPAYASSISAAGVALAAADERRSTPPRAGGTSGGLNRTGIRPEFRSW